MKYLLILLAITSFSYGCSNSTDPGTGGSQGFKHTIPGVGSTFEYLHVYYDSSYTAIDEVIANGIEIGGKKNVVRVETTYPDKRKVSTYYAYERNGDISYSSDPDKIWFRQPIESKQHVLTSTRDTVGPTVGLYEFSATPYKQNDLVVDGKTLKGFQIETALKRTIFDSDGKVIDEEEFDKEYTTWSHEIGMQTHSTFGPVSYTLQKYTLK